MGYTVGDLVEVAKEHRSGRRDSDGGRAFIQSINNDGPQEGPPRYSVKYIVGVGARFSPNVCKSRLSPVPMDTLARRRGGEAEARRPSLMSTNHLPRPRRLLPLVNKQATPAPKKWSTAHLLTLCKRTLPPPKRNAGLDAMKRLNKSKDKGWLRQLHDLSNTKQPTKEEKALAMSLFFALRTIEDTAGALVGHAWGVTRQSIHNWEKKGNKSNMDYTRKSRSDKGSTVFNSEKKRKAVFTPLHSFSKQLRKSNRGEPLSKQDISTAWKNATPEDVAAATQQSTTFQQQAPFLLSEIQRILQLTNGSITWERLASQLSGGGLQSICANTIAKYVMALPNSSYQTTRIHPHLSQHHKQNRYEWSLQFWIFWNNAKSLLNMQLVLCHMDEKWFFGIVVRKHNKSIPFLGVMPVSHSVHHKSHINKTMAIASTAFIPHGNNIEKGGRAMKISLERVGGYVVAPKTTYKRVYREDGTYHYPKTIDNISKEAGKEYWMAMEITGSNEGNNKQPKFSLLKWYLEKEIPRLEDVARQVFQLTGKSIVIRYQMDGAGPHRCNVLLTRLQEEFDIRGWILKFQPSQSPLTNIKDACIFPAMSKEVTAEQGLSHGSHVLETEQLWTLVKKCWEDFPLDTIARAYSGHHQIVNAIAKCEGGDEFAREHQGLHCGIRKHCIPFYENEGSTQPTGVEMIESMELQRDVPELKYPTPEVDQYPLDMLDEQELRCLVEGLPEDHDDWLEVNNAYAAAQLEDM